MCKKGCTKIDSLYFAKQNVNLRGMDQLPSLILSLRGLIPRANILHFLSIIHGIYSISGGGVTQLNISRYCSGLFYAPKKGSRQRIYGDRVDFSQLQDHQIAEKDEEDCLFTFFQINKIRTKSIGQFINVVIIRCYHKKTKKTGFVLLFSTDLKLQGMAMVDYYALRFQIEFNFRDAKQYFGLSDFKSIKPKQVTNAVGLSFFMVNLSAILIDTMKEQYQFEAVSILDLKTCFRAVFFSNHLKNTPVLNRNNILEEKNRQLLGHLGAVNMFNNPYKKKKAA